jgi:hypothetical protein
MPINHRKHSNAAPVGGPETVTTADWNDTEVGTGGADGLPLVRKLAHPDGMDFAATAAEVRAPLDVYSTDEVDGLIAANPGPQGPPGPQGNTGPPGPGVPVGGVAGQVLTKTSATDFATAWGTNQPILANNAFLQGYKADGTTPQNLIGIDSGNNIHVARDAGNVYFGYAVTGAVEIAGGAVQGPINIGYGCQGDISIGLSLAAGKNIYIPRLTVQGQITLQDQSTLSSSNGYNMIYPHTPSGTVYYAYNCAANFNGASGSTYFQRNVSIAGVLDKGGTPYTHPDFVFEHAYTGGITQFLRAHGATEYRGLPSLESVEAHTRETLRLPGTRGEKYDLFARGDELLAEVERLYLHMFSLNDRVKTLEARQCP